MGTVIGLVLVDDHTLVREGLARGLESERDIRVLADVGTAADAREACRQHEPTALLAEIAIPDMVKVAGEVSAELPATHIVFLSSVWHDHYIEQALAMKASGYITKTEHLAAVIEAIRGIVRGEPFFSSRVRQRMVGGGGRALTPRSRVSTLTARELEMLRHLALGMSKKQIAIHTDLSIHTVDKHIRNLMRKLDIHDRVALSRFAIREGLADA